MAPSCALENLLSELSSGDAEATQRVFLAYEPYLRMVVRRQLTPALRAKFDSMDIIQSVWADLLSGIQGGYWEFASPQQLRAFLVKVTRNRLIDRVRQQQPSMHFEQRLKGDDLHQLPEAQPNQVQGQLEADEMWQRLLMLCPPQHHGLLELKRRGFCLAEIAARTGLHEGSIRRILYELAARLADSDALRQEA
jgi:RNA polymerase sigma factor (sigma-70 family)